MKAILAALLVFGAAGVGAAEEAPLRAWTKGATPPLALHDLAGADVDLRKLAGQVVVVNFWATWCEPCIAEMPSLQRLRERLRGKSLEVLAVNYAESPEKVRAFLRKSSIDLRVLLDPSKEAADAWNAKGLPMTFVVDRAGKVRYWIFGERDWNAGDTLATIEKLVAEPAHAGR
ncbi:MAG TPA: TlpA disulfide reductase family protein [Usitatibacter sp.]|jgi:thiol-disulfide isomerase/thioredoxin|nr:TlpA disulfide reductase family protein [Usitatibacter sp.]